MNPSPVTEQLYHQSSDFSEPWAPLAPVLPSHQRQLLLSCPDFVTLQLHYGNWTALHTLMWWPRTGVNTLLNPDN